MHARSIVVALAIATFASPALAARPHRTLRTAQAQKTMVAVDQLTRDQARRREQVALLQAQNEQRDRFDRTVLLGSIAIAGVIVLATYKHKKARGHEGEKRS